MHYIDTAHRSNSSPRIVPRSIVEPAITEEKINKLLVVALYFAASGVIAVTYIQSNNSSFMEHTIWQPFNRNLFGFSLPHKDLTGKMQEPQSLQVLDILGLYVTARNNERNFDFLNEIFSDFIMLFTAATVGVCVEKFLAQSR